MNKTIEAIAAIIGRELLGWTVEFKPKARWPLDYSTKEVTEIRNTATMIYDELQLPEILKANKNDRSSSNSS